MINKLKNTDALKFIFAGNSTVTFRNVDSGNRFTFKVKKSKNNDTYFVSVLSGPENWTYLGTMCDGKYKHGVKSTLREGVQSEKVFVYILNKLKTESLPECIEIWHEGKCGKCGRTLTTPESIKNGLGPECSKRK
jgi:hypothetical protein